MAVPPTSGAPRGTIAVPRSLLILLSAALVAALLTIAFLLGRETERAGPPLIAAAAVAEPSLTTPDTARVAGDTSRPAGAPDTSRPADARAATPPASRSRPPRLPSRLPQSPPTERGSASPPAASPPVANAPAPAPVDAGERAAVARYLEQVDAIATEGSGMGNPESMAMAMLGQATSGDWTQFDELSDTQRAMVRQLRGVRAPAGCSECRAYHQQMISLLDAGASLLEEVKDGVASGNIGALSTLATTAQRLQSDAEAAQRLSAAIQAAYGL